MAKILPAWSAAERPWSKKLPDFVIIRSFISETPFGGNSTSWRALKPWGQSWQRGNYNINTSGQNWEWASQQTLHPEFWILKSFSSRFLTRGGKSLSTMADVLIRSFSKILSLLVGPTNVAIDNWTFQMFYKVQQTVENIVVDGNFIYASF